MIHILNREGTRVLDILSNEGNNIYWDDKVSRTIFNTEKYEFKTLLSRDSARHLRGRNRVVITADDGFFHEFIIIETVQIDDILEVHTVGSQLEIAEDEPFPPLDREGDTINTILDYALQNSRWVRGRTEGTTTLNFDTESEYKTPLQVVNRAGALFDLELRFRVEIKGSKIAGRYVDAVTKRGAWRGREIVHGKDLLQVKSTRDNSEIYTALMGMTPPREDGTRLVSVQKNEEARQNWGIAGKHRWGIYEPQSDEQDMTQGQIDLYTERELNKRIASVVEYEVDAVDLESVFGYSHEQIRLGDQVRVKADEFNPPIYLDARIISVEYSISDPTQKKFTLGEFVERSEDDIKKTLREIMSRVAKKANKILYDENGEVIGGLDDNPNFGGLYVGDLSSPNVPIKSQADIKLYVSDRVIDSGAEPSDSNHGQGWTSPLRTIAEAIRRIPEQLNHTAEIVLAYDADIYEYVKIEGFNGSGKIIIDGQGKWNTTLHNGMRLVGCQVAVEVEELTVIPESTYEAFATNAGKTTFRDCVIRGNQNGVEQTNYGLIAYDNGVVTAINCDFFNLRKCLYAHRGASVININNQGNGSEYGLYAATGGSFGGYGTAPTGSVANAYWIEGAYIEPNDFTFTTSTDQGTPSTGTTTGEWDSTDSGSYTTDYGGTWDSVVGADVLQGEYGNAGPYRGCWFFGSAPSTAVTGKTIKQIRIRASRANNSGSGQDVPIEFRAHTHETKPSGQPGLSGTTHTVDFGRGESKWVTLPSSFHSLFEDGSRKGIGIYSGTSNYARMNPSATLEITYEG